MEARHRHTHDSSLPPFVFPYDLGYKRNLSQVINWSGRSQGNGLEWQVAKGCLEFSLTVEQLEQKKLKRKQAVTCRIKQDYSGSSCPLNFGLLLCLCTPRFEPKIKVQEGDVFSVTRWGRYWVYGDKTLSEALSEKGVVVRGWFPRSCVVAIDTSDDSEEVTSDDPGSEVKSKVVKRRKEQSKQ
ncbi:palmitoyltransferase ZDHHC6-like [Halichondria panicea]|uniref:palmitoyltransferase ZDHHC6-like n=1 Tax=Halichondria panicea TaxID=6063 RepID=UPI00312B691D